MKLNTELLLRWIKDLRNPPAGITQGREALRKITPEGFSDCCLGRVCDVMGVPLIPSSHASSLKGLPAMGTITEDGLLTKEIANKIGFSTTSGIFLLIQGWTAHHTREGLVNLNDNGYTFSQIADLLYNAVVLQELWDINIFDLN